MEEAPFAFFDFPFGVDDEDGFELSPLAGDGFGFGSELELELELERSE